MTTLKRFFMFGIITIALPFGGSFTFTSLGARQAAVPVAVSGVSSNAINPAAVNSGAGSNTSLNWSGYQSTAGNFTSVTGTWTIPSVAAASSTMADATWVGIGGVTGHDLIQAGTQAITDPSGGVTYSAWYETLPQSTQPANINVKAGDSITASITQISPGEWEASLRDNTTGQNFQTQLAYNSSLSSAEWIEEMPTSNIGLLPLDNFGSVSFTGGSAVENGNTISIGGAGATALTMINQSGQVLSSPSTLGSDNASFTVTRSNASALSGVGRVIIGTGRGWRKTGVGVQGYVPRAHTGAGGQGSGTTGTATPQSFTGGFGGFGTGFGNLYQIIRQLESQENGLRNGFLRGAYVRGMF